ncbi:MAG: aldehyde ferredoxin oxidoreductase family protein [Bacillota bacterium]|jgi:aldehyde:ferredoxin oxidoreductase
MYGYSGKILKVDLTAGQVSTIPLTEEVAKAYLGGAGLGAILYADACKGKDIASIEPLSPENPLIFATGPLTGSPIPAGSRFSVVGRSPLTTYWGEANAGGFFGMELKKAGYDAIVITGAANKPVRLSIKDDKVEIIPANDLWGKDTYEVQDALKPEGRTLCIGQNGELLANTANIAASTHNFFGRGGLGALMGSKKLKAVTVKGTSHKYQPADMNKLRELQKSLVAKQKEHGFVEVLSSVGSISGVEAGKDAGDLPTKNWQWGKFDGAENIGAGYMTEHYTVGTGTCFSCPVACKRQVEVKGEGMYDVPKGAGPEYETAAAFGSMVLVDNQASIIKCNELCNRYGMDTITTGATIALAIECYEKGYITDKDTGGLKLEWGNPELIVKLVEMTGKREGFGEKLSKGMRQFVADLDPAAKDCTSDVKGFPAPFHDPRLVWALGIEYATGSVGASHVLTPTIFSQLGIVNIPELIGEQTPPPTSDGKAKVAKICQDFGAFANTAASICCFGGVPYSVADVIDAVNAATGFDYDQESMLETGERIFALKRCLSNIWGVDQKEDTLPKRLKTGVIGGPNDGVEPPIDEMVKEYYGFRGLKDNGCLKKEILERLQIPQDVIDQVEAIPNK